jgi:hypothetical protein
MTGSDRFERLIRWYPTAWRARYGDELTALLEDTYGTGRVPSRVRLGLAASGSLERARTAGLIGNSLPPDERMRGGSLLVLCGWALTMFAGSLFAKFSEHWDAVTPRDRRWLPGDGYSAVQWAGVVGVLLVLVAALVALGPFVRLIRGGGWPTVRRPVLRALAAGAGAAVMTAGVVVVAHHVGPHDRNSGRWGYGLFVLAWGLTLVAALSTATAAAVSVARGISLTPRTSRFLAGLAVALTVLLVVVAAGTAVWWTGVATYSPRFLGSGMLGTGNVLPPPLLAAAALLSAGLVLAVAGTVRIGRSFRAEGRG